MLAEVLSAAFLCVSAAYVADQRVPRGAEAQSAPPDNSPLATFRFTPHRLCALHHISDSQHHISIIQILFVRTRLRGFVPLPDLLPHPLHTTRPPPATVLAGVDGGLCGSSASLYGSGCARKQTATHLPRTRSPGDRPDNPPQTPTPVGALAFRVIRLRPPPSAPRPSPPLLHVLRTAPALSSAAPHPCASEGESILVHRLPEPSKPSFLPY